MSTVALWYLTRGTGVVALVLLTVVVVLGVLTRGGVRLGRQPRFVTAGLHRNASLLALAFLGVHITTSVIDPYVPIRVLDAVLPFVSAYRPVWLGLGALALDLLLAVVVTSLARVRLGRRTWRSVHWLAYASWPVAVVHALGTGSDVHRSWLPLTVAGSVVAVVCAVLWRLLDVVGRRHVGGGRPSMRARAAAAAAVVAAPLGLAGWAVGGPLAAGWAARAGTPPAAVGGPSPATAVPTGTAALEGTYRAQRNGDDAMTVVIDGRLRAASGAALDGGSVLVRLAGAPTEDGRGVQLTAGSVTLTAGGATYTGPVTGLAGGRIAAAVVGAAGRAQVVTDVQLSGGSATTGTVTVT